MGYCEFSELFILRLQEHFQGWLFECEGNPSPHIVDFIKWIQQEEERDLSVKRGPDSTSFRDRECTMLNM